jgi:hypothetical protein
VEEDLSSHNIVEQKFVTIAIIILDMQDVIVDGANQEEMDAKN